MNKLSKKLIAIIIVLAVVAAASLLVAIIAIAAPKEQAVEEKPKQEVITVATLQKIINVSELSSFTAVYNGVANVPIVADPKNADYHVYYEADVSAGVDFSKFEIIMSEEEPTIIQIIMPEVTITNINVDINSLEFIFEKTSKNNLLVIKDAYRACENDVKQESEKQEEILTLAEQNAKNILEALIQPLIENTDYVLECYNAEGEKL